MHTRTIALVTGLCLTLLFGCGGTGGGESSTRPATYRRNLGNCIRDHFVQVVNKIAFVRYSYMDSGDFRDLPKQVEFITLWRPRLLFEDEVELGITAVESKLFIAARARTGQTYNLAGDLAFSASLAAENRVIYRGNREWEPGPMTKMAAKYFGDIASDMRLEFKN